MNLLDLCVYLRIIFHSVTAEVTNDDSSSNQENNSPSRAAHSRELIDNGIQSSQDSSSDELSIDLEEYFSGL